MIINVHFIVHGKKDQISLMTKATSKGRKGGKEEGREGGRKEGREGGKEARKEEGGRKEEW